ncbi:asparagine-tRNA ligase [Kwoniella pini CBS 10737]|uniref:asparagine--tRNA ligase n=1 Tax=Kwoniella pini CBS 10737 TaxID=1296096 RepID=A0A1B9I7Y8_9TREE|nr:asparagine-tRNA ligase [Kwoniella pini CBS 10737]OCF51606.1 asparagine-tRNA ligase [Kwoniella pini CBS 10737]
MRRTPVKLSTLPPTIRTILSNVQSQSASSPNSSSNQSSSSNSNNDKINVNGWIKSIRTHKNVSFLEINDGTSGTSLQAVLKGKGKSDGLTNGTSVSLIGELKKSRGQGQDYELSVEDVKVLGECDSEAYPIQKKSLPSSILRENAHLRFRTSQTAAIMRIRDALMRDWHDWFEENQFTHIHTPILTESDCEGAGEVFTLLDKCQASGESSSSSSLSKSSSSSSIISGSDFFPHPVHLTVSSQLHLEAPTHSLLRTYTLSPSFRAEPSLTSRHLSEFYMLEGELGFLNNLNELLNLIENGIQFTIGNILNKNSKRGERIRKDLKIIQQQINNEKEELNSINSLNDNDNLNYLNEIISKPFKRITYKEALNLIKENYKKDKLIITNWGEGISTENEKWLTNYFNGPLFVTHYPKSIKPFYMLPTTTTTITTNSTTTNEEIKEETVECFDLLFPNIGEMAGGSLREYRLKNLINSLEKNKMNLKDYEWYIDLRKFGSIPHGGWGMGWERWISFITGISNIKDVVAYPRWKGHCKY